MALAGLGGPGCGCPSWAWWPPGGPSGPGGALAEVALAGLVARVGLVVRVDLVGPWCPWWGLVAKVPP